MNYTVNSEGLANDSNEWTNDNIGWRRTADEGQQMKIVRSNGWKPRPLDSRDVRGGG
jgi:hypothetical protein